MIARNQMSRPMFARGTMPPRNKITYADKIAGATGRTKAMGGGLMEATARLKRQGLRGGGLCKRGMNREAIGKNS